MRIIFKLRLIQKFALLFSLLFLCFIIVDCNKNETNSSECSSTHVTSCPDHIPPLDEFFETGILSEKNDCECNCKCVSILYVCKNAPQYTKCDILYGFAIPSGWQGESYPNETRPIDKIYKVVCGQDTSQYLIKIMSIIKK